MTDARTQEGSVAADISRGAVQLLHKYTGRGPTKTRTIISDDSVSIVMGDTLTKGERNLVRVGERDHVLDTRHRLQQIMCEEYVQLVEGLSGRKVEAFFSDNHIDPDYAVEFFLLESLPGTGDPEASPT
jgi:uncharacterized protein YbcI